MLDACASKNILGGFLWDYGYNDAVNAINPATGQPAGPLNGLVQVGSRYSGHVSVGKDSACPYWIDYAYASTLMAADDGMDGMWTDNHSPWDSFGHPPVNVAFGEWSVARFRSYLASHFTPERLAGMGVTDVATFDIRAALRARMRAWGGVDTDLNHHVWHDARWVDDPLWRAYMIYKRQTGTAALDNFYNATKQAAARAGKSHFFIAGNDIPFFSLGWPRGSLDAVSTEMSAGWHMGSGSRGIMLPPVGRFAPVYKLAREHAKSRFVNIWMYMDEAYRAKPGIASILDYEMLANHALPLVYPSNPAVAGTPASNAAFFEFVAGTKDVFGGRTSIEEVGVYYSSSSVLAFMTPGGFADMDRQPHQFAFYGWGTALGNLHIQYRPIPEWKFNRQTLDAFRVLIIPNADVFLPEDVENVLAPWVEAGGSLIITGNSGARLGEENNFDPNPQGSPLDAIASVNVHRFAQNIGMNYYLASGQRPSLLPQFKTAMAAAFGQSQPIISSPTDDLPETVGINVYQDQSQKRVFIDVNNLNIDLAGDTPIASPPLNFSVRYPAWLAGKPVVSRVLCPGAPPHLTLAPEAAGAAVSLSPVTYYASVVLDADTDGDGLSDLDEERGAEGYITDPSSADTDGDGLSDFEEVRGSFGLPTNPTAADTDGDDLNDYEEVIVRLTNPLAADTDGDGDPDGAEVRMGTDPRNPSSHLPLSRAALVALMMILAMFGAASCAKREGLAQ